MKINSILLFVVAIGLFSCYNDNKEELYPELTSGCDTTNVTYTSSVVPILNSYCLSCHSNSAANGAGGGIKLENYPDVSVYALTGKLVGSVKQLGGYSPMPKNAGKLSDCKVRQIDKWVSKGAPNN
jgi:hypothetical protein